MEAKNIHTADNQVSALISREEYDTIKSVISRIGCPDIFGEPDFYETLFTVSFSKFITNQPQAVMALSMVANSASARPSRQILDFVESLSTVNEFIQNICGGYDIYNQLDKFCEVMDEARRAYD